MRVQTYNMKQGNKSCNSINRFIKSANTTSGLHIRPPKTIKSNGLRRKHRLASNAKCEVSLSLSRSFFPRSSSLVFSVYLPYSLTTSSLFVSQLQSITPAIHRVILYLQLEADNSVMNLNTLGTWTFLTTQGIIYQSGAYNTPSRKAFFICWNKIFFLIA